MDRFIDAIEDLRAGSPDPLNAHHFDLFLEVLRNRFRSLHAKSTVDLGNIESVFGLVEMARLVRRLPGFKPEEIDELSQALRTVLTETILLTGKFNYTREQRWEPPRHYLALAGEFDRARLHGSDAETAFITFNYDLGLDFALHWSNFEIDYGFGEPARGQIPLFKLHGSLNWVSCKVCRAVRAIALRDVFQAHAGTRSIHAPSVKLALDPRRAHQSLRPHCAGDDPPFDVAVIPPSWNKTQYWEQLSRVWSRAARTLADAQEITIIGYSLPNTDSFFRDLLALGLEGPTRVRAFTVVNPDKDAGARFEALLGPEVRGRFHVEVQTFEEWVTKTYGSSPRIISL